MSQQPINQPTTTSNQPHTHHQEFLSDLFIPEQHQQQQELLLDFFIPQQHVQQHQENQEQIFYDLFNPEQQQKPPTTNNKKPADQQDYLFDLFFPQEKQQQRQQLQEQDFFDLFVPQQQQSQANFGKRTQVNNNNGIFMGNLMEALPHEEIAGYYNDDEPLIEKVKETAQNDSVKLELQIKAQRSLVKLKTAETLPAMATLKSSGGNRTSVDLICVIDNSGSMSGEKIGLVKETMKFLLETLTPSDRLSIITFNNHSSRLCGLKTVTGENMGEFKDIVDGIYAGGGTNINSGLQEALKTMRDRKFINKVTSIFLLSDGQDSGAENAFKSSLNLSINKELGNFTLHSFGFGSDHDEDLMTKLCDLKEGAFYFIKELATLDEAFCNALGGIISLAATDIIIKINSIAKNLVEGIKIKKVYGKMWENICENEYRIRISQMMSGIAKDFVFELEIPSINTEVGDLDRDHTILEGMFIAQSFSKKNISGECSLEITLLNSHEEIPDTIENIDVIENYLRVKAAEAIEENLHKADQNKYKEAQKGIDDMIDYIQSNKKARKEKMDHLVADLNQIRGKCSQQDYGEGRKYMKNAQNAHSKQNNFQYSNCVQSDMLMEMKSKKAAK